MGIKQQFFANAVFEEKGKRTLTARLRNTPNGKSFRFDDAPEGIEKNDGLEIELDGKLLVGEKYVSCESYKVTDIVKGAYVPKGEEMDADEYLASILAMDAPAEGDEKTPIPF